MPLKVRLSVFPGDENLACHLHVAQLACASQVTEGLLGFRRPSWIPGSARVHSASALLRICTGNVLRQQPLKCPSHFGTG